MSEKRIAIAFGFGKQSYMMLKKLLKKKPIIVTVIGEEDDLYSGTVKLFAKALGLKCIILKQKKSFHEVYEGTQCDLNYYYYNNILVWAVKQHLCPFDVLYIGRQRSDLIKRGYFTEENCPKIPPEVYGDIKLEFPLWNIK